MAFDPSSAVLEDELTFDPSSAKETSFDPVKDTVSNATDSLHRFMGGLTTGGLSGLEGLSRWSKMITEAQKDILGKVGLDKFSTADITAKGLGMAADVFGGLKQDVQTYSESKRNRERDNLFSAQLIEAGGNFAGQIATTAASKVAGLVNNIGQMFQQEYGAAKEKGADDLTAYQAGVYNLPAAFLDYFTESKMVKSLIPQQAKRTIAEVTKKIFTNAGLEGATEVIQDEYSNWLAGNALKYDQERAVENRFSEANLPETGKQIAKTFAIGGILGGAATTAFEALQPAKVDEKGLAKEERLEALQKELDQINETQEKTQTDTTEFTPIISTTIPEVAGNAPSTAQSEITRISPEVRQLALDTEAEKSLTEAEQLLNEPEIAQDTVTPDQSAISLYKVEEPLGMFRNKYMDEGLAKLSDESLNNQYDQTFGQLNKLEKVYDERELNNTERKQLGLIQDKYTQLQLEKYRREAKGTGTGDLFRKLVDKVDDLPYDPNEKKKGGGTIFDSPGEIIHEFKILANELESRKDTDKIHEGYEFLYSTERGRKLASNPDYKEVQQHKLGQVRKWVKAIKENAHKLNPAQMSLGTSEAVPMAPITSKEPISQPEAITGIPSESDLKKIDVLKKATDVLKEDWESAPQIEVVADVSAIPDNALTQAEKDAIKGNVSPDGLFGKDGKVYIIGDKVPNIQRVKELVLHETKAHYGFKSLFGGDDVAYKRAMQTALDEFNARPKMADALAARRGGFKDLADLVKAYDHLNVEHKEGKYAITEELLSRASELYHDPTKARPTWFNRIISRIKLALQPIMPGMKLNDQDIINLLGTKSTELLDAASKKVETGDAEIPKFSLSKFNILDKEIKTVNGSRYYHIDDPRGWISVRIADHKNKTQDASRGDLGKQIARRKSSSGMTNPHEINIVLEKPISTEKQAEDIISNILNEIPDEWLEKTEFPDKTIYGSSIFAKKTNNGWELENEETGQKLTIPGDTKFSLVADKKPAPAVHIGDQEFEGQKFPFFNLTEDIPGHPKNSTVSTNTLIAEGFGPPEGYAGEFKEADFSRFSLTKEPTLRSFSERQKDNAQFEQIGMADLVEKIDSNYQAVSNKEGAEEAAKTLSEIGIAEAMDRVDSSETISARDRQYLGIAAMEYWNNVAAKAETQEDVDIASRNMVHVIESLARRGTEYGQAIQAMRGRLTPEGWIRTTLNQFKEAQAPMRKAGKKVVDGVKKSVDYDKVADQIQTKTRVKNLIESFQKKVISESKKTIKDTIFDTVKTKQLKVEDLAKNLVEESGLNGKQAEALSKAIIAATNAEIGLQTKKYIESLKKTNSADKKIVKAMKDDITKIMDYSISGVLDDETLYNHLAEKLNLPFYDQKFIQEVKKDAERIKDDGLLNKSPMLKNKAIYDLGNKIAKRTGTSNYDIAQAYWYASVLSGIRTQLKNFVGTAGQSQLNNFLLSADALRRGDKGEVMAIYSGWLGGLEKGVAAASDALLKGDFTGQYSFEAKKAASALEQISDSPDKWKRIISNAKYVSRLMAAADILNASANAESRARLKAYQLTKDVNLSNQDRQKAINEILHTTPNEIKEAQLQAEQEGFKPESTTYRRRVNEILELQRPSDLNSEAREYGLLSTYNNEPNTNTLLGALAGFIEKGIASGNKSESDVVKLSARATRFLIPFTRIVANVGNEQLNYTPVGLLRLATLKNFNKDIETTQTDLTLLKAKILLGNGMLMGLAAMLSQWDDEDDPPFQIVGSGPSDFTKRSQWLAAGNKPWSIIWKDKKGKKHTATYTYSPFAMMLGVLGAYKDAQRYGNIDEKSAITKVAGAIANGLTVITDASFLSSVTSLMDVYAKRKDVESFSKGLVHQVARTAGGLAPNILKEFDSWFNKPLRDTKPSSFEFAAIFANQLPVIKDAVGKPMLNVLGEEIKNPKYPWQPFVESKEVDPIWTVLAKKQNDGVFISLPDAATKILPDGKRQTMTNKELYEYRKQYGQELKKTLIENMSLFEKADPETSKKLLEGWSAAARATAKLNLNFF